MMVNEVAARLCGFEHESEMIGKTDYDLFSQDRADAYVKDDQYVLKTGGSIVDRVELAPDPNHSINWFLTTKIPLYSHENEIIGLACIARNMTDDYDALRPYVEMNEVLEYVRKNYAETIKIEELAKMANLSCSQFERKFQKVFQITPTRHILNVRIRAACNQLSATNDTIATIALETGFYDHSHFIRGFKKARGVAPGDYRKQDRK
jgi:AraC-like DNA-binding protein